MQSVPARQKHESGLATLWWTWEEAQNALQRLERLEQQRAWAEQQELLEVQREPKERP